MPENVEICPPISIKMFDCRSFGRFTFVGAEATNTKYFLYRPYSKTEYEIMQNEAVLINQSKQSKSEGFHTVALIFPKSEYPARRTNNFKLFVVIDRFIIFIVEEQKKSIKPDITIHVKPSNESKSKPFLHTITSLFDKTDESHHGKDHHFSCFRLIWGIVFLPYKLVQHKRHRTTSKPGSDYHLLERKEGKMEIDSDEICNTTQMDLDWWSRYFASVEGVGISSLFQQKLI